jgi:TonB family protein
MSKKSTSWRFGGLRRILGCSLLGACCAAFLLLLASAKEIELPDRPRLPEPGAPHTSVVRNGTIEAKERQTLRLTTDLGSVRIVPLDPSVGSVVRYSVHIETDARPSVAQQILDSYSLKAKAAPYGVEITGGLPAQSGRSGEAQFWVQFEVAVPRSFNVEVSTEVGDIETQDIGGTAELHTLGGNIRTGRIGVAGMRGVSLGGRPMAKLETEGGQIQVADVAGDLAAFTAGGHIDAGNVAGDATLHTGGGHVRVGHIGGRADLETVGGNITVAHAESFVNVQTGGGQIDFGEVRGSVHAQTGGGGIRIMYVSGPMEVESNGGSICLTRVAGAVQAATGGGTITAWINPDAVSGSGNVVLASASQLSSGNGDIIVYLPRNLAANVEAQVAAGGESHIEADAALGLTIQRPSGSAGGPVRGFVALNGGGAPLKLRTTSGKIRLKYLDAEVATRDALMQEQADRLNKRLIETGLPVSFTREVNPPSVPPRQGADSTQEKGDWLESWLMSLEVAFRGGVHEDPVEFQKRILAAPSPNYPTLAQRAGVQGIVKLQVRVTKEGQVEVLKILEGEPVLADAAIDAVKKWRAKPMEMNGKKVDVISMVKFDFQLH